MLTQSSVAAGDRAAAGKRLANAAKRIEQTLVAGVPLRASGCRSSRVFDSMAGRSGAATNPCDVFLR
jgi:hypothetical protein